MLRCAFRRSSGARTALSRLARFGLAALCLARATLLAQEVRQALLAPSPLAFPSLAFVRDAAPGPEAVVTNRPFLRWTRVVFRPQQTNDFPEELKPVRVFPLPAAQIAGLTAGPKRCFAASLATRRIYRFDTVTGAIETDFPCPGESPAGLCWDQSVLWHADKAGRTVFGLNQSGKVLHRFPVSFEPSALVRLPDALLVSDWAKDQFHRLDPRTGSELGTERAPDDRLTGLAKAGRYLWCSRGDEIVRFDPRRGLPVCGFSLAPAAPGAGAVYVLPGAADAGEARACLCYADARTGQLVQTTLPRHGQWVAADARVRQEEFEMVYRNSSGQAVEPFTVLQHVPFLEMPGRRFLDLRIEPAPRALFRDDLGNVVAWLDFGPLAPGGSARCRIGVTVWTADRRMAIDPDRLASHNPPERGVYTNRFHAIAGEDSPETRRFVNQAVGEETNPYWKVRLAHDALCAALYYREPQDESVPGVLRQGYGVCRNYSAAMESFGRLLGVPVLNAWAPRHETCLALFPGVGPAIMEVTANDSGPDPASAWRRSRWFLGTSANEITTGVRGMAMHRPVFLDGTPYGYRWHYWLPASVEGIGHEGWWSVLDPATGRKRRF